MSNRNDDEFLQESPQWYASPDPQAFDNPAGGEPSDTEYTIDYSTDEEKAALRRELDHVYQNGTPVDYSFHDGPKTRRVTIEAETREDLEMILHYLRSTTGLTI
jgi:hypothetical protein